MYIYEEQLKQLLKIVGNREDEKKAINKLLGSQKPKDDDVEKVTSVISALLKCPETVEQVASIFSNILLHLVTKVFNGWQPEDKSSFLEYQVECYCLSKLIRRHTEVKRHVYDYFLLSPPPFETPIRTTRTSRKKQKIGKDELENIQLFECCLNFLEADSVYFSTKWKWSNFLQLYWKKGNEIEQLYCNNIYAILFNLTQHDRHKLINTISPKVQVQFAILRDETKESPNFQIDENSQKWNWNYQGTKMANVEGVLLPIYNINNIQEQPSRDDIENFVCVNTSKINLLNLSLGISIGKAICLCGPVGSGKTTLVQYIAIKTGRIPPLRVIETLNDNESGNTKGRKRKSKQTNEVISFNNENVDENRTGLLRIQLGEQTDSKVFLGQYRSTEVPGEFVWQSGVLTQAVINGQWLLLEDLDLANKEISSIISNLLENKYLSVPGFRERIPTHPGFQLFVTLRVNKTAASSQNAAYTLLEKYLHTVNIIPLSTAELMDIINRNYPKLQTISSRIVNIFVLFSSGCHSTTGDDFIYSNSYIKAKEIIKNVTVDESVENLTHIMPQNSSRLVSTRDLFKLCKRSNPTFSVTSAECAYSVFQNAVDLFCSHLPSGPVKTNLITEIGSQIGILPSRCSFLADEYKPDVSITSDEIKIGRVTMGRSKGNISNNSIKKIKLDQAFVSTTDVAPTFSYTRISACLLEKIAVAVYYNEPVLLVGETGVGKTSSVQFLAYKTNHKLIAVNMNNQSDISDLIGGFKPVELSFIITPIRVEFESLFKKCFDPIKNEKFLTNVSICFNRGEYAVLVKLMLKIVDTVFTKPIKCETKVETKWRELQIKLQKLNSQLANATNLSFAFIAGTLVSALKNGDWILLDEINLASSETLECLSTILEPSGSLVLLEKGDIEPIKRHPEFRIFGCMNPSTDIGKKDLPVGIRNRFTEFFVDELTSENDLIVLLNDYLKHTGIQKSKIFSIVKLYKKLIAMSQLELNDGLGNRPVYSLRTLCRALNICRKNLCGSVERNIYESFCLSFLTQLDQVSHQKVLKLIQSNILGDVKAILSKQIPCPGNEYINIEGYWIQCGSVKTQECDSYILTDSVKANLKNLARIISIGRIPILLQGPTSVGKTSMIDYLAKRTGNFCLRINNHEHTDLQEYVGTYIADVNGKLRYQDGVLVQALRNGYWIILDELNLAPSDILEALNRVLDDNRELFLPETQTLVKAHPNFMLFATQNPPGLYGGRKTLSRAFKNRFVELHFSDIPRNELEIILEKRCLIPKSYAHKMVNTMSQLQTNRTNAATNNFTLRDLFRWGNRYTLADRELLKDKLYDWNQHLVDEGYLVLSAKLRNLSEVSVVEDALSMNFRKKINVDNLYSLNENTSMVTKKLLIAIMGNKSYSNVVWTLDSRRMALLTAKSLEFNEPVLLVGPTGCGKTTVCQILANVANKQLRILNCHLHTEGADFLGGLRPHRSTGDENETTITKGRKLFEWVNGPLILSMKEGSLFLADEISLAEDSVLERLNCVLEPDRTILLAERGGVEEINCGDGDSQNFIIKASDGFHFLATMNPGGDFGKKELSPALRNRFTEIWCHPTETKEDLCKILVKSLEFNRNKIGNVDQETIASILVNTIFHMRSTINKFRCSIRDILAWASFVTYNVNENGLPLTDAIMYGLNTIFLDSLEMMHNDLPNDVDIIKNRLLMFLGAEIRNSVLKNFNVKEFMDRKHDIIKSTKNKFGISPFYVSVNKDRIDVSDEFLFTAPTTRENLFRLLGAMSLKKAILLEGPPGVGKTSIIENLAKTIGFKIVRINLCEHTDLADLFGTDLPMESSSMDAIENPNEAIIDNVGAFSWHDGPLLAALKANNTWILLDELNLAPQSVLEGLNAILDHRGEVFIPELNRTFKLNTETRIFGSQNPLKQGGGRKGLPQSFLNRFTKVYIRKLKKDDILHVVSGKHGEYFTSLYEKLGDDLQIIPKMVDFSNRLDQGLHNFEFGHVGGPFEVNLRDILRWCELISNPSLGFPITIEFNDKSYAIQRFNDILFTKMKTVYYHRMRSDADKDFILNTYENIFACDVNVLQKRSEDIPFYWTAAKMYFGNIGISNSVRNSQKDVSDVPTAYNQSNILLQSHLETLKSVIDCLNIHKPVIICGPTDSGKTKVVSTICSMLNQYCDVDSIDDSVTGSFQQIDLNRHLEDLYSKLQSIVMNLWFNMIEEDQTNSLFQLYNAWENCVLSGQKIDGAASENGITGEVIIFLNRLKSMQNVITVLYEICGKEANINNIQSTLKRIENVVNRNNSLNTGGHFEWIDSKFVKAVKRGNFICLEHTNLCSSAILDRLNSVFEPNGTLLMSEKGVGKDNDMEVVVKHKNFRAFLLMDPKNGELSRAMRNRCIEVSIHKNKYTENDLKRLVYENGITNINVVKLLIRIHTELSDVSEFTNFSVSHLLKASMILKENQRLYCNIKEAIYISILDVYIRSSYHDLLGYGLTFYRKKLLAILIEQLDEFNTINELTQCNFNSTVIKSNELNILSLVKLQCEPFFIIFRGIKQSIEVVCESFEDIFTDLSSVKFSEPLSNMLVPMLCVIYDCASMEDLILRREYIKEMMIKLGDMCGHELFENLENCNDDVSNQIETLIATGHGIDSSLPWNRNLFPDLGSIHTGCRINERDLASSAFLLSKCLVKDFSYTKSNKLDELDVISFSKQSLWPSEMAVSPFLLHLWKFVENLKCMLNIEYWMDEISIDAYQQSLSSYLWINRFISIGQRQALNGNKIDENLNDDLVLHFGWIDKYLLNGKHIDTENLFSKKNKKFVSIVDELRKYILTTTHPLIVIQKFFTKNYLDFAPYFTKNLVEFHEVCTKFSNETNLLPIFGYHEENELKKRFRRIMSDCHVEDRLLCTKSYLFDFLSLPDFQQNICDGEISQSFQLLRTKLDKFIVDDPFPEGVNDLNRISHAMKLLPVQEYYGLIALMEIFSNESMDVIINDNYFENINSIPPGVLSLIAILNNENCLKHIHIWREAQNQIFEINSDDIQVEFKEIVEKLPEHSYRTYSSLWKKMSMRLNHYVLNSLCSKYAICYDSNVVTEENSQIMMNGCTLALTSLSIFYNNFGVLRNSGLGDLSAWRKSLREYDQLVWNNMDAINSKKSYSIEWNHYNCLRTGAQILAECEFGKTNCLNSFRDKKSKQFHDSFQGLCDILRDEIEILKNSDEENGIDKTLKVSIINALAGAIQLNLLNFSKLVDPSDKNSLRCQYLNEDIEHLQAYLTSFKIMAIALNYRGFGGDVPGILENRIQEMLNKKSRCTKKIAIRKGSDVYKRIVKDITQYLTNCCQPDYFTKLIRNVSELVTNSRNGMEKSTIDKFIQMADDIYRAIDLWITNSKRFLQQIMSIVSSTYYRDLIDPIECSVILVILGMSGIQQYVEQKKNEAMLQKSTRIYHLDLVQELNDFVKKSIRFPSYESFERKKKKSFSFEMFVCENLLNEPKDILRLIKTYMIDICNRLIITRNLNEEIIQMLEIMFHLIKKLWDEDEENRRRKIEADESLIVTKTLCETEDDEEIINAEIEEFFPNYAETDFGDFVEVNSLEQQSKKATRKSDNKTIENNQYVLQAIDLKILCDSFVFIMTHFTRGNYFEPKNLEFITEERKYYDSFETKLSICTKIIHKYKTLMDDELDLEIYGAICLLSKTTQDKFIREPDYSDRSYNVYRDANLKEVIQCTELLERIERRTFEELEQWPDHAVLKDITQIIRRIYALPSNAPVTRFNTGFQLLRQKLDEWNGVAHKNNNMKDMEVEIAEYVQRWTRLELQNWRESLTTIEDKVQSKSHKFWFHMYSLLEEALLNPDDVALNQVSDVISKFIESASYGEFNLRMNLLKSFEQYLQYHRLEVAEKIRDSIISIFNNRYNYYSQFSDEISKTITKLRMPIEKKLKELVKIESYNKDLSYFSMRNNVSRVHRNLHKFLKEYEKSLSNSITDIFALKSEEMLNQSLESPKTSSPEENKYFYYKLHVDSYLAPLGMMDKYSASPAVIFANKKLLNRTIKLFSTARTLTKAAIIHQETPNQIKSFEKLIDEHLDNVQYLRNLEIDRNLEREKQKGQAKHILNIKRKALAEFYKTLNKLEINYRTGIIERDLDVKNLADLIKPFDMRLMLKDLRHKNIFNSLDHQSDNLNETYSKSIYKMKMLSNLLLTPNQDLDKTHLERMKGYSYHLYLMVTEERQFLSDSVYGWSDLSNNIKRIFEIDECIKTHSEYCKPDETYSFIELANEFVQIKNLIGRICDSLIQFKLILNGAPDEHLSEFCTKRQMKIQLNKNSENFVNIVSAIDNLLMLTKTLLNDLQKSNSITYLSLKRMSVFRSKLNGINLHLHKLKGQFEVNDNGYLPIGLTIVRITTDIDYFLGNRNHVGIQSSDTIETDYIEEADIDNELENLIHCTLIGFQTVFKKYCEKSDIPAKKKNVVREQEIVKARKDIRNDLESLNVSKINGKLNNLLLAIKYQKDITKYMERLEKLVHTVSILEQFLLMGKYYLIQLLGMHKLSLKMLSAILTVFIELGTKGFCIPPDLMQDEDGKRNKNNQDKGEGFGLEDGETGENDVSDQIESEDQLEGAHKPGDEKENDEQNDDGCKEEKGIDMSEDFESKLQDVEKSNEDSDEPDESDNEDADKQMGETADGADKLDEQIWGSDDEEKENDEDEPKGDEDGKGSNDKKDEHNDLSKNGEQDDKNDPDSNGLDATDNNEPPSKEKKKQKYDIDKMDDPEIDEDQVNPYHNELEEPPEPDNMEIGDNCNLDGDEEQNDKNQSDENPFDIDEMKDKMDVDESDIPDDAEENNGDNQQENDETNEIEENVDSEDEGEFGTDQDAGNRDNEEEIKDDAPQPSVSDAPDTEIQNDETNDTELNEKHAESKDETSKQDNLQAMPEQQHKGSSDQVEVNPNEKENKQENSTDVQSQSEEKEGVGQSELDESNTGHEGVSDAKNSKPKDSAQKENEKQMKKPGASNEDRTLADSEDKRKKNLKTIDKIDDTSPKDDENDNGDADEADEYQHIKEASKKDKVTLDTATDDQSKKIHHEDMDEDDENMDINGTDELMDVDEVKDELDDFKSADQLKSENLEKKSKDPSKSDPKSSEIDNETERMKQKIDGDLVDTHDVPRNTDTSAHCSVEILQDMNKADEPTSADILKLKKMYGENIRQHQKAGTLNTSDIDTWHLLSSKMATNARELCEQLRLILEPTKCTRLKGDYRTGRRINMKKIIPYIASQFRKDKIWLRRTKPAQRDYKITIAIDDSKSMHHNNSKTLTLQTISLVSQALSLLESGKLSIVSFGEKPQILVNYSDQLDGPKLVNNLNFDQNSSKIAELLDFIRVANEEDGVRGSDNGIFENLLIILSDGRNIFSEGETKVKNSVKLARLNRIFIVYVIIDNPENKHSILDIRIPTFGADKTITMKSYMDTFPFPYFVIVRNLEQLPSVLSDAMRQWFELVNSE